VLLLDAEGHISLANARAKTMFGYSHEELLGLVVESLLPERFRDRHIQHRAAYMAHPQVRPMGGGLNLSGRRKDGSEFPVEVALSFIQSHGEILVICLITDVSAQKQIEAELAATRAKAVHAGKLAALGEMATGVAHELNQPLTAMQFEADYLKALVEKKHNEARPFSDTEIYQIAENLSQDIARCRRIINYLRAFGRASGESAIPISIHEPLENSFALTAEWLKAQRVNIQWHLAPDLPAILGDVHKLEQVFVSLFSNAAYAMAQREAAEPSTPTAYTKRLEVQTYLSDDGAVIVAVRDNGIGIPQKYYERIFEPFFTTKPVGEGAGLGLSVSYGIVMELGGELTFESAENAGATFRLRFPAIVA
jgi:PAS domain S-box-containing protein